ncbi:lipoprotein, partial [Haemophilus parahaemolyticus]
MKKFVFSALAIAGLAGCT